MFGLIEKNMFKIPLCKINLSPQDQVKYTNSALSWDNFDRSSYLEVTQNTFIYSIIGSGATHQIYAIITLYHFWYGKLLKAN